MKDDKTPVAKPPNGSFAFSKRFKKKQAETSAELMASWFPGSTVTIVIETDGEHLEIVKGVVRG